MKNWFTAGELAGVPGMPSSDRQVRRRAAAEHWRSRQVQPAGGGRPATEYLLADLPQETREHLLAQSLKLAPACASASAPTAAVVSLPGAAGARRGDPSAPGALARVEALPALADPHPALLGERQRHTAAARLAVIKKVAEIRAGLNVSLDAAIGALNTHLQAEPDGVVARLVLRANARPRGTVAPALTRQTYYRWLKLENEGGFARLAPQPTHYERVPPWALTLLRIWQRPTKPSLTDAWRALPAALAEDGVDCELPSYAAVLRFVEKKVGKVARHVGRLGPRDLRTKLPFVRRTFDQLEPGDIYISDGHSFKGFIQSQIQRPDGRGLFRPEVTPVLDVATRKLVGWSVGRTENQWDVMGALMHAFTTHGVCAVFYADNGPGFKNKLLEDDLTGLSARLGFEVAHSIAYNSQARGVIEAWHKNHLKPLAARLGTGITGGDKEHLQKVHLLVTKDQRRHGVRVAAPTFDQFTALLTQLAHDYNHRPHRSLGGESPQQRWDRLMAKGCALQPLGNDIERDLFWPQTRALVRRGELRVMGRTYFSLALTEYDGEHVLASYDIHDPAVVVVRDEARRWICEAELEANARPYMPQSVIEQAREKRAEAAVKRAQRRVDRKQADLDDLRAIEHAPSPRATFIDVEDAVLAPVPEPVPARPTFSFKADRYEWLMAHRDQWREDDRAWVQRFVATDDYALLAERWDMLGITWKDDGEAPFKAAQ